MGLNFTYNTGYNSGMSGLQIWLIISIVIAILGGLTVYFIFLRKENKFTGALKWFHDFFNFKKLLLEDILKVSYLILAAYITLSSFGYIGVNVGLFFGMLIGGNIALRIVYETSILLIKICQNTSEINNKLKK